MDLVSAFGLLDHSAADPVFDGTCALGRNCDVAWRAACRFGAPSFFDHLQAEADDPLIVTAAQSFGVGTGISPSESV